MSSVFNIKKLEDRIKVLELLVVTDGNGNVLANPLEIRDVFNNNFRGKMQYANYMVDYLEAALENLEG